MVSLELHRHGIDAEIDDRNEGQVSNGGPLTSCSVLLIRRVYDTDFYGNVPRFVVEVQRFQVRRLQHSLLVELAE